MDERFEEFRRRLPVAHRPVGQHVDGQFGDVCQGAQDKLLRNADAESTRD